MYKAEAKNINFYYGDFHALKDVSLAFPDKTVTALIGPSGCGKSTFLRLFNRMNDLIDHTRIEGEVLVNGQNIYSKGIIIDELRKSVGMVFQKPNPFPKTVFENVAYGLRVNGIRDKNIIEDVVVNSLEKSCIVGRSEGQAEEIRFRAFRRPAAAFVHSPRAGSRTNADPDG